MCTLIFVKAYIYFGWKRRYKDVYTVYDYAGCIHLAYFRGTIRIIMTVGKGIINVEPNSNFSTYTKIGGLYRFLCILRPEYPFSSSFIKSNRFEIHVQPSTICLLPFLHVAGGILKIGHNGYPPDMVYYHLSLFVGDEEIISTRVNYIIIPLVLFTRQLFFKCTVTFIINETETNYEITRRFTIINDTKQVVQFYENDFLCLKYIDEPITNGFSISNDEVIFLSELFFLIHHSSKIIDLWVTFTLFFMFCVILFLIIIRKSMTRFTFAQQRRKMHRRMFNDKLYSLAKIADESQYKKLDLFQQKIFKYLNSILTNTYLSTI